MRLVAPPRESRLPRDFGAFRQKELSYCWIAFKADGPIIGCHCVGLNPARA